MRQPQDPLLKEEEARRRKANQLCRMGINNTRMTSFSRRTKRRSLAERKALGGAR